LFYLFLVNGFKYFTIIYLILFGLVSNQTLCTVFWQCTKLHGLSFRTVLSVTFPIHWDWWALLFELAKFWLWGIIWCLCNGNVFRYVSTSLLEVTFFFHMLVTFFQTVDLSIVIIHAALEQLWHFEVKFFTWLDGSSNLLDCFTHRIKDLILVQDELSVSLVFIFYVTAEWLIWLKLLIM